MQMTRKKIAHLPQSCVVTAQDKSTCSRQITEHVKKIKIGTPHVLQKKKVFPDKNNKK